MTTPCTLWHIDRLPVPSRSNRADSSEIQIKPAVMAAITCPWQHPHWKETSICRQTGPSLNKNCVDPTCPLCSSSPEDLAHFLKSCPSLDPKDFWECTYHQNPTASAGIFWTQLILTLVALVQDAAWWALKPKCSCGRLNNFTNPTALPWSSQCQSIPLLVWEGLMNSHYGDVLDHITYIYALHMTIHWQSHTL